MDRKYRHRGYQDTDKPEKEKRKDRPPEGRSRHDMLGPRTPRMVARVTRARCANCGAVLQPDIDPNGQCPKCGFELHSCKQCVHFDTGARFECTQPIPERIPRKDARNDCTFYELRVTVEKDTSAAAPASAPAVVQSAPSSAHDARKAFEDLFKK